MGRDQRRSRPTEFGETVVRRITINLAQAVRHRLSRACLF
jgi:hypothetical protein